jgi:hypothetical protein
MHQVAVAFSPPCSSSSLILTLTESKAIRKEWEARSKELACTTAAIAHHESSGGMSHHLPGAVGTMAQPTSPSLCLPDAIATYPPQNSQYTPGQDMLQYPQHQGPHEMYRPPDWPLDFLSLPFDARETVDITTPNDHRSTAFEDFFRSCIDFDDATGICESGGHLRSRSHNDR